MVTSNRRKPAFVMSRVLSGETGLGLCTHLRAAGASPDGSIIRTTQLMTAWLVSEAGADDYALKPYRSEAGELVRLYLKPDVRSRAAAVWRSNFTG